MSTFILIVWATLEMGPTVSFCLSHTFASKISTHSTWNGSCLKWLSQSSNDHFKVCIFDFEHAAQKSSCTLQLWNDEKFQIYWAWTSDTIGIEEDEIREKNIQIVCFAIAPVTAIQTTKTTMRTSKSIQTQTSSESFTLDCYFHLFHCFCRRRLRCSFSCPSLSPVHISFFSFLSWVQIHESMGCNEI